MTPATQQVVDYSWTDAADDPVGNRFDNNLIGDPDGDGVRWGRHFGAVADVEGLSSQWTEGTNITGDPLFVAPSPDPANPTFELSASSPARDKGRFLARIVEVKGDVLILGEGEATAFFCAESWGHEWHRLLPSDTVHSSSGASSRIVDIDAASDRITVDDASGFATGDELTVVNFAGSAPDIGISETYP